MARSLNGNHIGRAARPTVDDWMDSVSVDNTEKILTVIKSHMDREDYYNWFNGIFDAYYYKDRDKYIDQVRAKRQEIMNARAENDKRDKSEAIRVDTGMLSKLYHCENCGFMSTIWKGNFQHVGTKILCVDCAECTNRQPDSGKLVLKITVPIYISFGIFSNVRTGGMFPTFRIFRFCFFNHPQNFPVINLVTF